MTESATPDATAADRALAALRAARAELRDAPAAPIGGGLDHRAWRVGDVVLRVAQDADADLAREAALLAAVGRRCPVPVPAPVAFARAWIAYPLLAGVPLLDVVAELPERRAQRIAGTLGEVLAALWATPREEVAGLVEDDDAPLAEWREEAAELAGALAAEVPAAARDGLARFLREPLPPAAPARVLSHADLGAEHVLVDPAGGRVTGIIDWSDAAILDPAKDLGLILRDLGPEAFVRAVRVAAPALAHGGATPAPNPFLPTADPGLAPRARVYAVCLALEDLAFGLETGRARYAEAARAALVRLLG